MTERREMINENGFHYIPLGEEYPPFDLDVVRQVLPDWEEMSRESQLGITEHTKYETIFKKVINGMTVKLTIQQNSGNKNVQAELFVGKVDGETFLSNTAIINEVRTIQVMPYQDQKEIVIQGNEIDEDDSISAMNNGAVSSKTFQGNTHISFHFASIEQNDQNHEQEQEQSEANPKIVQFPTTRPA